MNKGNNNVVDWFQSSFTTFGPGIVILPKPNSSDQIIYISSEDTGINGIPLEEREVKPHINVPPDVNDKPIIPFPTNDGMGRYSWF